MTFKSRGMIHHVDSTQECPSCGRRFVSPGHAVVAEESSGFITFGFKSKQTNLWGIARVPVEGFTCRPIVTLSGRSTSQFFGVIRVGRQHSVPPAYRDDPAV